MPPNCAQEQRAVSESSERSTAIQEKTTQTGKKQNWFCASEMMTGFCLFVSTVWHLRKFFKKLFLVMDWFSFKWPFCFKVIICFNTWVGLGISPTTLGVALGDTQIEVTLTLRMLYTRHARAQSLSSCLTLCSPRDCMACQTLSVHGILQARILQQVTMLCSSGSSSPTQVHTCVSCTAGAFVTTEPAGKPLCTHHQANYTKIVENLTGSLEFHALITSPLNMQKQYRRHWPNSHWTINGSKSST